MDFGFAIAGCETAKCQGSKDRSAEHKEDGDSPGSTKNGNNSLIFPSTSLY